VIFTFNEIKDSAEVTVGLQPGLEWKEENYQTYVALKKEIESLADTSEKAYARIRAAEKSIRLIKDALTYADDSTKKKINERIDSLQKKIDPIKEYYFGKDDLKGIQDDSHTLISQLYTASYSVDSFENGANAKAVVGNCKRPVEKGIEMIDSCMKNECFQLQTLVEQTRFTYFKN
jgi:prefoldin subunit 5